MGCKRPSPLEQGEPLALTGEVNVCGPVQRIVPFKNTGPIFLIDHQPHEQENEGSYMYN